MSKNKDLILQSAKEIFSSKSFEQVTIKEICAHAGVANSTFYYHFKTKEEMMDCLRERDEKPLQAELLNLVITPDLMEQILKVCTMCVIRAERHGYTLTAQYYKRVLSAENDCQQENHAQEKETARILIEHAQHVGLINSSVPAETLAKAAIRLTRGVIIDWCAAGGSFNLREEANHMVKVLLGMDDQK